MEGHEQMDKKGCILKTHLAETKKARVKSRCDHKLTPANSYSCFTYKTGTKKLSLGLVRTEQEEHHKALTWCERSFSGAYPVASRAGATLTRAGRQRDGLAYPGSNLTWPRHTRVALGELLPLRASASSSVK